MATVYPLVHKAGRDQQVQPGDVLQAPIGHLDIIPWQGVLLTTTLVTNGVQALIGGSNFSWNAARGAGRKCYLETLSSTCTCALVLPDGTAAPQLATNGSGIAGIVRSAAVDMSVSGVYQLRYMASGGLTASLRWARIIIE